MNNLQREEKCISLQPQLGENDVLTGCRRFSDNFLKKKFAKNLVVSK
jgi:hypothetical protein